MMNKNIKKETLKINGTLQAVWGRTVWFGSGSGISTVRRYYYASRSHARNGDISDDICRSTGRIA